jgi:acyl dehydratase
VIASLAWPSVALVLLYHLRPQLRGLAARMTEFVFPGGKVSFAARLEEAREKEIEIRGEMAAIEGSGDVAAIQGTVTAPPEDDPYFRLLDVSRTLP